MTPPQESDCIFCRIAAGDAPCHRVFEDDDVLVFMDIQPVTPGHTLIIPKPHYENLFESPEDVMASVARVSVRVARAIRAALSPDGVFVAQTNGVAAGQTVFHYHLHLIPRWQGGSMQLLHGRKPGDPAELARWARQICASLGA